METWLSGLVKVILQWILVHFPVCSIFAAEAEQGLEGWEGKWEECRGEARGDKCKQGQSQSQAAGKYGAPEPARGQEAMKEKKLQGEEEEDCDREDTQKYRVNMGGEGPRGGGDEPKTNYPKSGVFTHLSFIPKLDVQALASEGKFTETEENCCAQT